MEPNPPKHLICIIGNDGSGKTTITSHLNKQNILCIERSSRELTDGALELQQQIKRIDQLTFAYGF
jgi:broad-specificity NMP kinase